MSVRFSVGEKWLEEEELGGVRRRGVGLRAKEFVLSSPRSFRI